MLEDPDCSINRTIIYKLLSYIIYRNHPKNNSLENDDIFQDIVKCKSDELTSEKLCQLNSAIKIKTELLRHSLLTHRWKDASEVLEALFLETGQNATPICQLVRVVLELRSQLGWSGNMDTFIESAIATSINDALTIQIDRFLHEAAIKFEHGVIVGAQHSSASLEDFAAKLRDARRHSTGRRIKNIEIARKMHIDKLYAGSISYIQAILSAAELDRLENGEDLKKVEMNEPQDDLHFMIIKLQESIRTQAQTANNYFQEAMRLCPIGPWDLFISMHTDLLRRFYHIFPDHKQATRLILESFCESNPRNKNAWKMLAEFYVASRLGEDAVERDEDVGMDGITVLERICEIDCYDETCLLLVQSGLSKKPSLSYLFKMLDGFQWKDSEEIWMLLYKELIRIITSDSQEDKLMMEEEWATRFSWWSEYHFVADKDIPNSIDFLKATVSCLLNGKKNKFFREIWKKRCMCTTQDLQHLLIIAHNLNNKIMVVEEARDANDVDNFEFITYKSDVVVL